MAEIAVNLVLNELVQLIEEDKLSGAVRRNVFSIRDDLEFIRPFLRDVDERAGRGEIEENVDIWMRQLRTLSLRLEDVIDKYRLHLAQNQPHGHGLFYYPKNLYLQIMSQSQNKLAGEIKDITATIRSIQERGNTYGLRIRVEPSSSKSGSTNYFRRTLSMREDNDVMGMESPQDELRKWLAEEASPNRMVIAVVGTGGLGKTTLIQKVYKNQIATGDFLCRAWITVSRSYKREDILRSLIRRFYKVTEQSTAPYEIGTMGETSLISMLRDFLQEKRYAVVLDDVWSAELWESIQIALPDNNKSSRVIVTTRNDHVASSFITSGFDHVFKLTPLAHEKAMELFCRKVFHSGCGFCPPELKALSEKIVKKCEGIPLAIVAIGGLLRIKDTTLFEWQKFYDSLPSQFNINLKKVLFLSYVDLSSVLKPCFLYFSIFPEDDYSISHGRLVRLWIAEGFIEKRRGITLEQSAEEYLAELVHRSLVQVSKVNSIGKARRYRVHGVMRELIISTTKDMDFCQLLSEEGSCFDGQVRRLSVQNRRYNVLNGITQPNIRSVFTFGEDKLPDSFVGALIANFKLLKVLDFEDAPIDFIPEEVGNLLLLKYLSLRNTKVKTLPESISRLQNLLTLDIKNSLVSELPSLIYGLRKLRHLLAYVVNKNIGFEQDYRQGVKLHERFGCLEALQKLYFVEAYNGRGLFKELEKLRHLRKLGIKNLKAKDGEALCTAIGNMRHLEALDVWPVKKEDILDLQHISSPPPNLQQLYLHGRLESFPSWISELRHLVRINLRWSRLKDDPLEFLQHLPYLLELKLMDAYDGEFLCFKEGGFQELKVLELRALDKLSSVIVETEALPLLQTVHISSCWLLKQLPREIEEKLKKTGGEAMEHYY